MKQVATLVVLGFLAVLVAPARAAEGPLAPLTQLGAHLDKGFAAFLEGKGAAEAFAPWKATVKGDGAEALRKAVKDAGGLSGRSLAMELELHLTKGDKYVYRIKADLWVNGDQASLVEIRGSSEEGDTPPKSLAPAAYGGERKPFADAAKALREAFDGDGWKTLPWADPEGLRKVIPPEMFEKAAKDLAKGKERAEEISKAVKGLEADGYRIRVDDQAFLVLGAEGALVGIVEAEFELKSDGTEIDYEIKKFEGARK